MLGGCQLLLCLEWVLADDRLGKLGQAFPAGLGLPVALGISGSRHGSTGVAWGQCRCQDKWNSLAALLVA
jgi:hypothetical protein